MSTKPIEVGCIVEMVRVFKPENAHLLGRQAVVTGFYHSCGSDLFPEPHVRVITVPKLAMHPGTRGVHPSALRRIDPPDWQAPIQETETLDTSA